MNEPSSKSKREKQRPSVQAYLLRARRRRWATAVVAIIMLAVLVVLDRGGYLLYRGSDLSRYHEKTFTVVRVVDGDTLHIDAPDGQNKTTVVRLWGIDTPEIAKKQDGQITKPAESFADEARQLTEQLCQGQRVRLNLESHQLRGRFGRLLAHIELPDGLILNERLLQAGLATADKRFSHARMDRYLQLERTAKTSKVGLWSR